MIQIYSQCHGQTDMANPRGHRNSDTHMGERTSRLSASASTTIFNPEMTADGINALSYVFMFSDKTNLNPPSLAKLLVCRGEGLFVTP